LQEAKDGLTSFLNSWNSTVKTITGESMSVDSEFTQEYVLNFRKLAETVELTPDQVYNINKTGLY
jgi:hypothetical protein